ncbi:MAG: CDP-alcohol phosphatidyltransferase family protein [Candidatus Hadarchaeales archaeon]
MKEKVRNIVAPIATSIAARGITPNTLTLIGLLVGMVSVFFFARSNEFLGGIFLLICGIFDLLDGAVAKFGGMVTAFGGVLDSTIDRLVDFAVLAAVAYGGLAEAGWLPGWLWCFLAIEGSFLVSYIRARAEAAGAKEMDVGLGERPERMLILGIGALVGCVKYAVVIVAFLANLTASQRVIVARKRLSGR